MDKGRIAGSAVKLAEAASFSDDPWFGHRLHDLARELAATTHQVLDAARPTQRTSSAHWSVETGTAAAPTSRNRILSAFMSWAGPLIARLRREQEALAVR
jgi:hypothetical protein